MADYRFAVLGDPVEHSRSPEIHGALLRLSGLDGTYERIRADREVLRSTVEEMRHGVWQGLNITMPLKGAAADLADDLSPQALRSHSVNTLSHDSGRIYGQSTDSTAFLELITDPRFADIQTVHLIGAGGSASAALAAFGGLRQVYVTSRNRQRAESLAGALGGDVVTWGTAVAGALLVNTTPLGMNGEPLPDGLLSAAAGLIDLPYAAEPTPAVQGARNAKLPHADGHEFLLRQAIASFHLWTEARVGYEPLVAELTNG